MRYLSKLPIYFQTGIIPDTEYILDLTPVAVAM